MTVSHPITSDDVFVLGNLGAKAVVAGLGDRAANVLAFMQKERPDNAGGFLMQAIHLFSSGEVKAAIEFLEAAPVFEAEINRDEALAFHLVLLQSDGQYDRALDLGHVYLGEDMIVSESAHHTIRTVIDEIEAAIETTTPALN